MIVGTLQEHVLELITSVVVVHLCMLANIQFNLSRNSLSFLKKFIKRDIFSGNCLEFASYYQDKMVLQREPASAVIWGTGELLGDVEAILDCSLQGTQNYTICVTLLLNSLVLLCFYRHEI